MKSQLSTANMFALLVNGKFRNEIAIPPYMTHDQIIYWLEQHEFTNNHWSLAGIFEYSYSQGAA